MSPLCLSSYHSVYLSVCLSALLIAYHSVCLSVRLPIAVSVCPVCFLITLSVCPVCLPITLSVCLSAYRSVCLSNFLGPILTLTMLFLNTDAPHIDPLPPVRVYVPGETLVLNCTARGGPEPTITWYRNRKFIYRGQALVLTNDTTALGLYTCRASNNIQPDDIASVTVTSLSK